MFDELFDYSFDNIENDCERIEASVLKVADFDPVDYDKHMKQIVSKIYHNQKNLTNYGSPLWQKLKQKMINNLEKVI